MEKRIGPGGGGAGLEAGVGLRPADLTYIVV
jgi:hypothetical protein